MPSRFAIEARLAATAAAQGGAFSRAQACDAGFGAAQIERRVRAGAWIRMFPRVYRYGATPMSGAASHWGAVLWAGPDSVLSHASAAAIWRMRVAPDHAPEVSVPATRAPRVAGVRVHRVARMRAVDVVGVRGLPVTAPVRTIVDLATMLGDDDLRAALEQALVHRLVTVRAVGAGLEEIGTAGRPGAARLRALLHGFGPGLDTFGSGRVRASARMAG